MDVDLESSKLFVNKVVSYDRIDSPLQQSAFRATVRSNIANKQDVKSWVADFAEKTCTGWIVLKTFPSLQRKAYKEIYVCQENGHNKNKKCSQCLAQITVEIKLVTPDTKKKDAFLRQDPPLQGTININSVHNHSTHTTTFLTRLHPSQATKHKLNELFEDGHGPTSARTASIDMIKVTSEQPAVSVIRGDLVPTKNSVSHYYRKFRTEAIGTHSIDDQLEKLRTKVSTYEQAGITVTVSTERPYSVIVSTPIMQRAQQLSSSSEIIFIDSSSSCDVTQASVTLLLTASKAGAVPLAVLLHENQSQLSYTESFKAFKSAFPDAFGGNSYASILMTDNSAAEKGALREVWPQSRQLLCQFHVPQAVWRWIWSSHKVKAADRQRLMTLFLKVMRSKTVDEAEQAMSVISNESRCQSFVNYIQSLYDQQKEQWVLAYRNNVITRGHETNNYAEATVRLLKDIMLDRQKAFNVVSLVGYIIDVLEPYYENRLYEIASGRPSPLLTAFSKLQNTAQTVQLSGTQQLEPDVYQVPSSSGKQTYVVNLREGVCTCSRGERGALCKHQLALSTRKELSLPNLPAVTCKERHQLAYLALGDKSPPVQFFMTDVELLGGSSTDSAQPDQSPAVDMPSVTAMQTSESSSVDVCNDEVFQVRSELADELKRLPALLTESPSTSTLGVLRRFTSALRAIETEEQLISFAVGRSTLRMGRKIRVQPTSTARRRPGVRRTGSRLPAGRPVGGCKRRTKAKRNLWLSISQNRPNAKSHGAGH